LRQLPRLLVDCSSRLRPRLLRGSDVTFAVTAPANATAGAAATETATVVASTASVVNYVTWTNVDTVTVGGSVSVSGTTIISSTAGTVSADGTKVTFTATTAPVIKFLVPATVGTFTVTSTTAHDNGLSITYAVAQTLTVSVVAAPAATVYNHSVVGAFTGFASSTGYLNAAGALFVPKASQSVTSETRTVFSVKQYSSADETAELAGGSTLAKAVTVSLSGVGVLSDGSVNNVTYLAYAGGSYSAHNITVSADGRSGVATVVVAVDGVALATKTITFYGTVAKYTAAVNHNQIAGNNSDSMILTVKSFDSNGIAVPGKPYASVLSSISAGVETASVVLNAGDTPGVETYTVKAAAKYLKKITVGNGAAETATVTAKFVNAGVKKIVVTADKAAYAPGEKATFSVVATEVDGDVVGDATYTLAIGGSTAFYGAPTSLDVVDGKASFTAYMPVAAGPAILTATLTGSSITSDAATLNLSVVDPAATAQAAAITALQTSVATLTTTVASLVASMTAQIKVINATMLKIQKALAALAKKVK